MALKVVGWYQDEAETAYTHTNTHTHIHTHTNRASTKMRQGPVVCFRIRTIQILLRHHADTMQTLFRHYVVMSDTIQTIGSGSWL
jgi:hypothetical protein